MKKQIITISNVETREYFFSTDHCQHTSEGFVPCTCYLPMHVTPRPSLPSGIIETKEDYMKVFHVNDKEIPNPNPEYQA